MTTDLVAPGFADDVRESATLQIFHDYPQLFLHQGATEHFHHILVPVIPHDHHLRAKWTDRPNRPKEEVKRWYLNHYW